MHGLGLFVLAIGAFESAQAFTGPLAEFTRASAVIVLGSLLVGGMIGEVMGIEDALTLGGEGSSGGSARGGRFMEGFVVASLVFCVRAAHDPRFHPGRTLRRHRPACS